MSDDNIPPGHTRPPRKRYVNVDLSPTSSPSPLVSPGNALVRALGFRRPIMLICACLLGVQIIVTALSWAAFDAKNATPRDWAEVFFLGSVRETLLDTYSFRARSDLGLAPDHRRLVHALSDERIDDDAFWALRDAARVRDPNVDIIRCKWMSRPRASARNIPDAWQDAGCQAVLDVLDERNALPPPTQARPLNFVIAPFLPMGIFFLGLSVFFLLMTLPWVLLRFGRAGAVGLAVAGTMTGTASFIGFEGVFLGRDIGVHGPAFALAGLFGAHLATSLRRICKRGSLQRPWYTLAVTCFLVWAFGNNSFTGGFGESNVVPGLSISGAMLCGALLALWMEPKAEAHRKRLRALRRSNRVRG